MVRFSVRLGGAVGSGARYLLATGIARLGSTFPYGTLAVNLIGSFLIGLLMQASPDHPVFTPAVRLALTTGVLGGFTTFSAFSFDTVRLAEQGAHAAAAINVFVSVAACLFACWLGMGSGRLLWNAH